MSNNLTIIQELDDGTKAISAIEQAKLMAAELLAIEPATAVTSGEVSVATVDEKVTAEPASSREEKEEQAGEQTTLLSEPEAGFKAINIEHPDGSMTITCDDVVYRFHQPHGRDLSKMRKLITPELDEVEMLAVLISVLQDGDKLTPDQWLDEVPLHVFNMVGGAINSTFRLGGT